MTKKNKKYLVCLYIAILTKDLKVYDPKYVSIFIVYTVVRFHDVWLLAIRSLQERSDSVEALIRRESYHGLAVEDALLVNSLELDL